MNKKVKITAKQLEIELAKRQNDTWESINVFLKKNKVLSDKLLRQVFWQSKIPVIHFKCWSQGAFFEYFLYNYFKRNSIPNLGLLSCFFGASSTQKNFIISYIKKNRVFENEIHWNSFLIFKNNVCIYFKELYNELEYIRYLNYRWKLYSDSTISFIKELNYEEIILYTISYFESVKRARQISNNYSAIVLLRLEVSTILEKILQIRGKQISPVMEIEEFKKFCDLFLTFKSNGASEINNPEINYLKRTFSEVFNFHIEMFNFEYNVNLYLTGHADFKTISGLESMLVTNDNFIHYRKALDKTAYDDTYFSNQLVKDELELKSIKNPNKNTWDKEIQMSVFAGMEYLKFLELDNNLTIDIDIKKLLKFLYSFSKQLMPQKRLLFGIDKIDKATYRELPKRFKFHFKENYLVSFTEDELREKLRKYNGLNEKEIDVIFDLLVIDLLNKSKKATVDICATPLLKVGNLIIWPSSIQADTRWEVTLHRKFLNEKKVDYETQTEKLEEVIKDWFVKAGFASANSIKYYNLGNNGEIDCIAYKENTLFLLELKNTYVLEDVIRTSAYKNEKFEKKASAQLSFAKEYIKNNYENFKNLFKKESGVNIDCKLEELKIETIILSNIYDSDDVKFKDFHVKISMFELMIILTNDRHSMLNSKVSSILGDKNFSIPVDLITGKNNKSYSQEDSNLWTNSKECSANDLISAIKERKVYSHMSKYDEDFKDVLLNLDVYKV